MNKSNLISDLKTLFKILPRRNRHTLLLNQIGIGISSVVSLISVALVPLFFTLVFPEIASSSNKRLLFLQNEISRLNLSVLQLGVVVISLILISNGILAYFSFLNFRISNLIFRDMSTELFRYFLHKDMAYHLEVNSAFIKSKVQSDCSRVVNQVLIPALNIIPGLVTLGMVVFGLGILNWKLTFIIFSFCLIVFVSFSELFKKKIRQFGHHQTCLSVTYHSTLSEGLNSLKETKILGKENLVIDEFFNVTQLLTSIDAKSSFFQAAPKFIGESAVFVLIIVLGCFAAAVDPNLFSISELAMFGIGSLKALPSINVIFSNLAKMNSGLSAIDHIKADLISAKHEKPFKFAGIPVGAIKLSHVDFSYPKTSELIFRDLNLSINPGDKIALVGPSGSGKSTLIDLILGLLPPTSGAVEFDSTSKDLYRVSYVPQKIFLMDKSIEENIYFGRSELRDEQALQDCLIASRASEFVSKSDKGVKTTVGEDGCRLSGGERQRVGIARALINKPSLLIVDEGTSAMDPNLEAEVLKNILSNSEGLTLIWVTHRYQNLALFDRVYKVESRSLILQAQ